jgi:hypothetical protein
MIIGIMIICSMMIFTYVIFDRSESVFDSIPSVKDSEIEKLRFEDLSKLINFIFLNRCNKTKEI